MATNSTSRATGIINHFRSPLLRMAGLLAGGGGLGFGLRQMRGWVEAVDRRQQRLGKAVPARHQVQHGRVLGRSRSEEHTSELQSLMRISYAVFCLKKKKKHKINIGRRNK